MCMIGHDFCSFYRYFLYRHTEKKKNQVFGESTLSVKFWFNLSRKSAEVIFNVFSISHKKKNLKKIVADTQIIRT